MNEVKTRTVAEQKVLSSERRTLADQLPQVIGDVGNELHGGSGERGIEPAGPSFVIYHGPVTMDADGPIEICLPIDGEVEPFGSARVRVEPAHEEAFVRLTKAEVVYPEILEAYKKLERWFEETGKQMAGSPREVMFAEWAQIRDDDEALDVAWPYLV